MGSRPSDFQLTQPGPLRLFSTTELLKMPEPEWLVENVTPIGALMTIYGEPECAKSFIALDFALCVATGRSWQGREVKKGFVVYIAAEGGTGIAKRVRAWLKYHQIDPKEANIAWLVESIPVNATSEELATLMNRILDEVEESPTLIIIDTLARCFDGDENQQEDMGRFVAGTDIMRKEFKCTVAVVHHTNLSGARERGNTALRGACDTMIFVSKDGNDVRLKCAKQKDTEHFADIELELYQIDLGFDTHGKPVDSCVVRKGQAQSKLEAELQQALDVLTGTLVDTSTGEEITLYHQLTWDDWRARSGLDPSRFQKVFYRLKRDQMVYKVDGLWRIKETA